MILAPVAMTGMRRPLCLTLATIPVSSQPSLVLALAPDHLPFSKLARLVLHLRCRLTADGMARMK